MNQLAICIILTNISVLIILYIQVSIIKDIKQLKKENAFLFARDKMRNKK